MEYIAYFVLAFTAIQLLVSLINVMFRQKIRVYPHQKELVSVLIPARNEESNMKDLLEGLLNQSYQTIEIIVFNDESTDRTAEIVKDFATKDPRVKIIESSGLPVGWLGKNFACHSLAKHAHGKYFLFLDADVRLHGDCIYKTLHAANKYKLGLLTVFPKQDMETPGENITVPVMTFILLTLLPLIFVRKSKFVSLSAANGQFMLFNADIYKNLEPHKHFKQNKVEDIAIIRHFKRTKIKTACLTSMNTIRCRMYRNFKEAVDGFSKNLIMFFGNSFVLAMLFWLITTFGFLPVIISMPSFVIISYFASLVLIRILVSIVSQQSVVKNILFYIPQQLSMGIIINRALKYKHKKQYQWKGRNIT
ncbi:MAG: glycosyltransferase family 2 protein [Bacteroidales bacterium]|nr:glycosyltransferase family 2 protein [Bacteroidales bacterium]